MDTSTVFKIEFAMQGDKGNAGAETFYDGDVMLPNGAVLFTVTLKDDFGDEYVMNSENNEICRGCSNCGREVTCHLYVN